MFYVCVFVVYGVEYVLKNSLSLRTLKPALGGVGSESSLGTWTLARLSLFVFPALSFCF